MNMNANISKRQVIGFDRLKHLLYLGRISTKAGEILRYANACKRSSGGADISRGAKMSKNELQITLL